MMPGLDPGRYVYRGIDTFRVLPTPNGPFRRTTADHDRDPGADGC